MVKEKISAQSTEVKVEAFQTLQILIESHPLFKVRQHAELVWSALQHELFSTFSTEVMNSGVQTAVSLINRLCQTLEEGMYDSTADSILQSMLEKCKQEIFSNSTSIGGHLARDLISGVVRSSLFIGARIVHQFIVNQVLKEISAQTVYFESLDIIISIFDSFTQCQAFSLKNEKVQTIFEEAKPFIIQIFKKTMDTQNSQMMA